MKFCHNVNSLDGISLCKGNGTCEFLDMTLSITYCHSTVVWPNLYNLDATEQILTFVRVCGLSGQFCWPESGWPMCMVDHQAGHLELDGPGSLGCNGSTFPHMICHSRASYFGLDLIAGSETQNRKEKRIILFSAFTCLRFLFYHWPTQVMWSCPMSTLEDVTWL